MRRFSLAQLFVMGAAAKIRWGRPRIPPVIGDAIGLAGDAGPWVAVAAWRVWSSAYSRYVTRPVSRS